MGKPNTDTKLNPTPHPMQVVADLTGQSLEQICCNMITDGLIKKAQTVFGDAFVNKCHKLIADKARAKRQSRRADSPVYQYSVKLAAVASAAMEAHYTAQIKAGMANPCGGNWPGSAIEWQIRSNVWPVGSIDRQGTPRAGKCKGSRSLRTDVEMEGGTVDMIWRANKMQPSRKK